MDYRALPKLSVNSSAVGRQRRYAALRFLPWLALCVAFSVAAAACSGSGSGGPDGGGNPYGDLALTMYTGADIVGGDQLALSDLQGATGGAEFLGRALPTLPGRNAGLAGISRGV